MRRIIIIVALVAASGTAHAEMSAKALIASYDAGSQETKVYYETVIAAVYNGITWVQADLKAEKTICEPKGFAVTDNQVMDILKRSAAESFFIAEAPYGYALYMALKKTMPCG